MTTRTRHANASRVALVTGGTRGIGLGIAEALANEGYALALCGRRSEAEVKPTLEKLRSRGCAVHYLRRDIADSGDRRGLIDDVKQCCGALHVLVNNAGVAPRERRDIIDATEESFDFVLGVNLRGPYFLTQAAARWMLEQAGGDESYRGCIITVSSVSATMASVHRGEYCIAKAGLAMAVKLWAARLAPHGLPVYEIRPGIIETDMTAGVREKYDRLIADGLVPQRRWGTPADVGKAAAALARGDLPFSTGQVVMVDGGLALSRL